MIASDVTSGQAMEPPPRLVLDRTLVEAWARELTMIVDALAELRERRDRPAEAAARHHDEQARSARPATVRPLSHAEATQWHGGDDQNAATSTWFDPATGRGIRVRYGPTDSGRWVVDVQVDQFSATTPTDGAVSQPTDPVTLEQVAVSCRSERDARDLADELISSGPEVEKLRRLRQRTAQRAARQAAAAGRVQETDPDLLERVRDAVREHWQPELADRVIGSRAFPRFARGLSQLESRGATVEDGLRRSGLQDKLAQPWVRDPAAFGAAVFEHMLTTIDGEVVNDDRRSRSTTQEQGQRRRRPSPTPGGRRGEAEPPSRPDQTAEERAWLRSIVDDTVWPALREALPEPLCQQLRNSDGYKRLADELAARHAVGWSLNALLAGLPADRIARANDPAGYLRGILGRRVEQRGPEQSQPGRLRVDQHAMARLVREAFPYATAQRVLSCSAWPALCEQMQRARPTVKESPTVTELLEQLPARAIARARKPAAYAAELLRQQLAIRRGEDPAAEAAAEDARLGRGGADAGPGLDPSSVIDRIALDDLPAALRAASPLGATRHGQLAGEELTPIREAQLLLTAAAALRDEHLGPSVVAVRDQLGAADPTWVVDELVFRGLVTIGADGRGYLRDGQTITHLSSELDLPPVAPLYAAAVAAARDPSEVVNHPVTTSDLVRLVGPIPRRDADALVGALAHYDVISAEGDRLITPDQLPELLRRINEDHRARAYPLAPYAAGHRQAAEEQLKVAGEADFDAAIDRGTDESTAAINMGVANGPGHARVDDDLAAGARAVAAHELAAAEELGATEQAARRPSPIPRDVPPPAKGTRKPVAPVVSSPATPPKPGLRR
jgi:hypothetical protein